MLVGVPREIKDNEYRVGIVPSTVRELADKGHQVVIETQAGAGAGFVDADYQSAGAEIVPNGAAVFGRAELIVKVKEPLAAERKKLSRGQVVFTYLHLPAPHSLRGLRTYVLPPETLRHPSARADLLFWLSRRIFMPLLVLRRMFSL